MNLANKGCLSQRYAGNALVFPPKIAKYSCETIVTNQQNHNSPTNHIPRNFKRSLAEHTRSPSGQLHERRAHKFSQRFSKAMINDDAERRRLSAFKRF